MIQKLAIGTLIIAWMVTFLLFIVSVDEEFSNTLSNPLAGFTDIVEVRSPHDDSENDTLSENASSNEEYIDSEVFSPIDVPTTRILLAVIAYNRPKYLSRTLSAIKKNVGERDIDILVFQDGPNSEVSKVAEEYDIQKVIHVRRALIGEGQAVTAFLAQHYKFILDTIFFQRNYTHAILLEDDMEISVDFFTYFEQTMHLLDEDDTIWCISSWNDNGFKDYSSNSERLLRTNYFPGLGWMLKKSLWEELAPKFPLDHWDNWMRIDSNHNGRDCIVPEISRNRNFGVKGANTDEKFFKKYLARANFNEEAVDDFGDLGYLIKENYEDLMKKKFLDGTVGTLAQLEMAEMKGIVRIVPYIIEEFGGIANKLQIWHPPRAYFKGAAILRYKGGELILADRRECPFLEERERVNPTDGLQDFKANQGQSCTDACKGTGRECSKRDFPFINTARIIRQHFPCKEFDTETGADIPNYVPDPRDENFEKCLVSISYEFTCEAKHRSTQRLCPCV